MIKPIINKEDRNWVISHPDSLRVCGINLRMATMVFYRELYKQNPWVFVKSIGFLNVILLFVDRYYYKLFRK